MQSKWQTEFGDEYAVPVEITGNALFVDTSWHNDMCPSFTTREEAERKDGYPHIVLWVDHPDASKRVAELGGNKRFMLCVTPDGEQDRSEDLLETDDVTQAVARFVQLASGYVVRYQTTGHSGVETFYLSRAGMQTSLTAANIYPSADDARKACAEHQAMLDTHQTSYEGTLHVARANGDNLNQ